MVPLTCVINPVPLTCAAENTKAPLPLGTGRLYGGRHSIAGWPRLFVLYAPKASSSLFLPLYR